MNAFYQLDVPLKVNMVVTKGSNEADIIPMAQLAEHRNIQVRFLEEMPFNGLNEVKTQFHDPSRHLRKAENITAKPDVETISTRLNKSKLSLWKGGKAMLGLSPPILRTFCGSCNRLRVTPTGQLKTCLYGKNDLRSKRIYCAMVAPMRK